MKFLAVVAILVACAHAKSVSDIVQKYVPSFSTGFVIKGHEATPYSAPYIVSLSNSINHKHDCGGSIISKEWIVTAAHCIKNSVNMSVVAGLHDRSNFDNNTQIRIVDFGKVHENFSGGVGPYDIALLHLSKPLSFNKRVQPASLPAVNESHSGKTHLYGWGQPKSYAFSGALKLQTVETEIMELSACREVMSQNSPLDETNICTKSMGMGISACNGDSGGPLVIEEEGVPAELVGLVSWGIIPCGVANKPSVYTRVSAYIDWAIEVQYDFHKSH